MAKLSQDRIANLIIYAFSRSDVAEVVGHSALRAVIRGIFRDMYQDEELHLQPLWEVLQEQPGFDLSDATPVACKLKVWEDRMGFYEVVLPDILSGSDGLDILDWADMLDVSDADVDKVLAGEWAPKQLQEPEPTTKAPSGKKKKKAREKADLSSLLHGWLLPLAALALALFGFVGYTIYGFVTQSPAFEDVSADFRKIPVTDVKRLGTTVGAVLNDDSWLLIPKAERRTQLGQVLASMETDDIESIVVLTKDKKVLASATRGAEGGPATFFLAR